MFLSSITRVILIVFLPLLLVACASAGLSNLQAPQVSLSNIEPSGSMTFFEQRYDVALRVQNPNNTDLHVTGMNYNVVLNGQDFARGVSRNAVTIPALGEQIIHVTVTNSPLDWVKQIERLNSDPSLQPSYKVNGALFLRGFGNRSLAFSQSGKFLPQ